MSNKEILVPFDLTKAKAGAKLRTKDGYDARIVCYDRYGNSPIVALVKKEINKEEVCHFFKNNGQMANMESSSFNLCIVEEVEEPDRWIDRMGGKVKGWCLAYKGNAVKAFSKGKEKDGWKSIFATKKQAQAAAAAAQISQIIANDARFGGVVTDEEWNNEEIEKFILHREHDRITLCTTVDIYNFIAFHTHAQAALFLEENRDIVEQFYIL